MHAGSELRRCLHGGQGSPAASTRTSMNVFFTPTAQCAARPPKSSQAGSSVSLEPAESRQPSVVLSEAHVAEHPQPSSSPDDDKLRGDEAGDIAPVKQESSDAADATAGIASLGSVVVRHPGRTAGLTWAEHGSAGLSWAEHLSTALTKLCLLPIVCSVHTPEKRKSRIKSKSLA